MSGKYYLIDFENVNTAKALKGLTNLGSNDKVYIFYTEGAKIDLNLIDGINFILKKVEPGEQSLDKYLVSYLGYLVAENKAEELIIVSNDKGFDRIIKFWQSESNAKVSRVAKLETAKEKQLNAKTKEMSIQSSKKVTDSNAKTQLNTEIQRAVASEGYDKQVCNKVASIVVSFYGNEKMASEVHNALATEYSDGAEVYAVVKSIVSKYARASASTKKTTKASQPETVDVKEIRTLLTKAGKSSDVANYVGQLVQNNIAQKNGKQTIYRAIVSKYGQSGGLDIYNRIKKKM